MPIRKIHNHNNKKQRKTVKIEATRKEEIQTLLTWVYANL